MTATNMCSNFGGFRCGSSTNAETTKQITQAGGRKRRKAYTLFTNEERATIRKQADHTRW